jgi:predicted transcriptional regulator
MPQAKTRIMQKTNTSYNSLQNHLLKLKELGLIDLQSGTSKYAITQRGLGFLEKWVELQELLTPEEHIVITKANRLIHGRNLVTAFF